MAIPPDLLRDIDHMDPLPLLLQRLMEMQGQEIVSSREPAEVVEYDQAIAASDLRVANSSIVGSRVHIGRVGDAVMRLGWTRSWPSPSAATTNRSRGPRRCTI